MECRDCKKEFKKTGKTDKLCQECWFKCKRGFYPGKLIKKK